MAGSKLLLLLSRSVVSDSVRPHRRQPTRLPCPWDSPGKNTGVSCHFLLQCMKVKSESEFAQSCLTLSDPMDCSLQAAPFMGFYRQKNTGGGCHRLLQIALNTASMVHLCCSQSCPSGWMFISHCPTCPSPGSLETRIRGAP